MTPRQEPDAVMPHVRIRGGVFSDEHSYSDCSTYFAAQQRRGSEGPPIPISSSPTINDLRIANWPDYPRDYLRQLLAPFR
jgi:hypothetical protein